MSTYSLHELASIVQGEIVAEASDCPAIHHVLLDSRRLHQPATAVFIAIRGDHHDSHHYLDEVRDAGVRVFIVEREPGKLENACVILVKHAVTALQRLATFHRNRFDIPVIGITGSNGKTIVKEWLNILLAEDFNIVRSPKSWNSQVGVPLSVLHMEPSHTLGMFEAGISQPGEMEKLARVIRPTLGVFTSLGTAHSENFLSRKQQAGEKLTLFASTAALVCPDDPDVRQLVLPWLDSKKILFATPVERAVVATHAGTTTLRLEGIGEFDVPFADRASLQNVITCICAMHLLDHSGPEIQERLGWLSSLEMRLQLLEGSGDSIIVNDAYSNDLQSLEIALDFLHQHARGRRKVVILSDILQSGLTEAVLHERIHSLLVNKGVKGMIGVGPGMVRNASAYHNGVAVFETTEDFLRHQDAASLAQAAILVKGARDFRFERIVSLLQEKTHDTVLEINLNALAHNLHYYRSKLRPETKVMVMVKAFGYGSGAQEVASLLEFNKVDYLAVAYTDEGVALRKAGVSLPIMVMNAEHGSLATLIRHKLEPELFSFRSLEAFQRAIEYADITHPYPVHLKLDTGMHRLGFEPHMIAELAQRMASSPALKVASVFTHLAATDEPPHDAYTKQQLQLFEDACTTLATSIPGGFLRHALNTGGISRFSAWQYDMVRLGVGLYGVEVSREDKGQLQTVSTLRTIISQLKNISKGESVGYSRKFVANTDMRIATIPVGYADGLRRSLSNGVGEVIIHGIHCRVVGNVCMDMMMIDVTHVPCAEGDEVIVFGRDITLEEVAVKCGTIAYEILTSISQRVRRIYISE